MEEKTVREIRRDVPQHWVGDGFPVRTMLFYGEDSAAVSPFLLLDYAGPAEFGPTDIHRGVGEHPHRGFETVTIVYQGELEHRDSSGSHGVIGPGDVQWMTAASGVVHEEFHSERFTREGGTFEVVQLWVNLPATLKMSPPRYQEIRSRQIPSVPLNGDAGTARIIAGTIQGTTGPASTFTPVLLWDLMLHAGRRVELNVPNGYTAALLVRHGGVRVSNADIARSQEIVLFDRGGMAVVLEAQQESMALFLSGAPINEPIAGRGPFVMNTSDEIRAAIQDYQSGRMGSLSA